MGKKIMITGVHGLLDSGEIALLVGAITSLKRLFPDAQFYMGSTNGEIDKIQLKRIFSDIHSDIKLIRGPSSPKILWFLRAILLFPRYIPTYSTCDVGLHIGADGYSDIVYHNVLTLVSPITHSYQLLLGWFFRKPTIACSMSIGPFNTVFSRPLARFTLNRVTLITVREEISKEYLERLGVTTPIHLVADLAFLMEPCSEDIESLLEEQGIPTNKQLACIAPSQIIPYRLTAPISDEEKKEVYIKTMATVVDYLSSKGLEVLLLCQTTGDRHDDREIARQIQAKANYRTWILDNRICTPQQIKAIMGRCEIMISSKLHSAIAATSVYTPTVTLAYHPKIYGIIGDMIGQKDFIVDIRSSDTTRFQQNLIAKIEECWLRRAEIRKGLQEKLPSIREMALHNIQLIAEILKRGRSK